MGFYLRAIHDTEWPGAHPEKQTGNDPRAGTGNQPFPSERRTCHVHARKRYYLSLHPEKTDSTLVVIDYAKINEIDAKDPAFNTYLTSLVEASYQNSSTSQKALTLVPEEKLQEQTTRFITLRNRKALSYLTSQGVPESNLRIETMKPELLNTYTGKNQYKINLVLPGDEQTPQE